MTLIIGTKPNRGLSARDTVRGVFHWALAISLCLAAGAAAAQEPASTAEAETWITRLEVMSVTVLAVVTCVFLHYEALSFLTFRLRRIHMTPRPRILVLIFAILCTHVLEIWVFGGAYFWLLNTGGHGTLLASHAIGLPDAVYFSAVCYTTLGLGDIVPTGAIRFLVGTESLTGFVLITWSASFTYFEMERFWKR